MLSKADRSQQLLMLPALVIQMASIGRGDHKQLQCKERPGLAP